MAATLDQVLRAGEARRDAATGGTLAECAGQIAFMTALRDTNTKLREQNEALQRENEQLRGAVVVKDKIQERLNKETAKYERMLKNQHNQEADYNKNYEQWTEFQREHAAARVIKIQRKVKLQKALVDHLAEASRWDERERDLMRQLEQERLRQQAEDRVYAQELAEGRRNRRL